MKSICPLPVLWNEIFQELSKHAITKSGLTEGPLKPLILAGWAYSSDNEKSVRWQETVAWAELNGCRRMIERLTEKDFYFGNE